MAEDKVTKEQRPASTKNFLPEQQEKSIVTEQKPQVMKSDNVDFQIPIIVIGLGITIIVCGLIYWSGVIDRIDLILKVIPTGVAFTGLLYVVATFRLNSWVHYQNLISKQESQLQEKKKSKDTNDADFSKKAVALELIREWESKEMWQARLFESALQNSARRYTDSMEQPYKVVVQQKTTEDGKERSLEIPALNKVIKEREILLNALRKNDTNIRVEVKNILTINPSQNYFRTDMIKVLNFFEKLGIAIRLGIADEETLKRFFFTGVKAYKDFSKEFIDTTQNGNDKIWREFDYLYERWKNEPIKSN